MFCDIIIQEENFMDANQLIKYLESLGLMVNTTTKARGHLGFFMKNRIDISRNVPKYRVIPTLLHEFAHYIHYGLEPDIAKTGGTFTKIFREENPVFETELFKVTNFVDENSLCVRLFEHKARIKEQIKEYENIIKKDYPGFLRSKVFREFDKYIKKSNAKYLLKYDRVKILSGFWRKRYQVLSVTSIEEDFPKMPAAFCAYIRLRSCQRKQKRVSSRINRIQKYYKRPTELFARLVEGLYIDKEWVCALAPYTTERFYMLLEEGYYNQLKYVIS